MLVQRAANGQMSQEGPGFRNTHVLDGILTAFSGHAFAGRCGKRGGSIRVALPQWICYTSCRGFCTQFWHKSRHNRVDNRISVEQLEVLTVEGENMKPDPTNLLEIADIKIPLIGFYDVPDPRPFEPFARPKRCFFSCYEKRNYSWALHSSMSLSGLQEGRVISTRSSTLSGWSLS